MDTWKMHSKSLPFFTHANMRGRRSHCEAEAARCLVAGTGDGKEDNTNSLCCLKSSSSMASRSFSMASRSRSNFKDSLMMPKQHHNCHKLRTI